MPRRAEQGGCLLPSLYLPISLYIYADWHISRDPLLAILMDPENTCHLVSVTLLLARQCCLPPAGGGAAHRGSTASAVTVALLVH